VRVAPLNRLSGRLAVAALIVGALPLLSSSPALAAPAAPGDLTPDSVTIGGQPVLGWSRVTGAVEYDVQISTSPDFSATLYDESTENSHATPISNLPTGLDLYWRVRGVTGSDVHGAWAEASFAHTTSAGPDLLTPDDGAQLQQPEDTTLLTWTPVNGATSYTVEVDTDDAFIGVTPLPSVKGTGATFENPAVDQPYFWHVRANFAGSFASGWSATRTFEVLPLPAPELVSPSDSSLTQIQDVVLDWAPVPGADHYEIQASTDDQFNTTVIDQDDIEATRYAPNPTINNDQYWWRVRAVDVNGHTGGWSTSLNQFQRNWPDRPTLVYPQDESVVSTPLYYEWDGVPHASSYRLEVSPDPSFSPGDFSVCTTTTTTYTPQRLNGDCAAGDTTYWRVRALDSPAVPAINGLYSEIHSFTYAPGVVTLLSPPDGAGPLEVPTLRWAPYPSAEDYRVTLRDADGSTVSNATTDATSWTRTGTTRLDPADGPFHWTVQANLADGSSTSVPLFGFDRTFDVATTLTDDPEVAPLTPTSPADVHGVRPPTLTWEPWFDSITGAPAAYYRVFYGHVGSPNVSQLGGSLTFPYPAGADDEMQTPDDYYWFARAYSSQGTLLATGPTGFFTLDELGGVTGRRLSLTGQGLQSPDSTCARQLPANPTTVDICNNLQQTPVLEWDAKTGAAYYMVYISRDRELTNMVYSPTSTSQTTVNTIWTPTDELADSQAGTAYYWFIRPCNAQDICDPEPTLATNAFDKRSNPITGLTETEHDAASPLPAHGPGGSSDAPDFSNEVVLSWDDYLLTSQAGNDKDVTGLPSQVEAKGYKVEISTDPNFSSSASFIHRSVLIDQTSYEPYKSTLPEGPLYWRVQAVDGSGNALAWSLSRDVGGGTQAIEKRSPAPELVAPGDGDTVSGTPAFRWDALAYASKYDVQIAEHGDTTFSSGSIAVSEHSLEQTTYVIDSPLTTDGSPYVWRVRRLDADGKAGAWSDPESFLVAADAPSQISPNDNAFVSAKDALFRWLPVDGATSYRFERRAQGSTSSQETKTTTGLAWAPQTHIPDGKYEWRVSSRDANNQVIGVSPWRPFRVDATSPTVIRKVPVDTGHPKTVIKVDFSERVSGVTSSSFKIFQKGSDAALAATVKSTNKHKSATLDPARNLKVGKSYIIKLLSQIKDPAGHSLKPVTWTIKIVP
jgi:hypothetical protein